MSPVANTNAVEKLKQFDIEMGKGASTNADIIPPASFGQQDVPFLYMYVSASRQPVAIPNKNA